jgi:predicted Rossmann-fold nucleotide-binding protein
VILYGRDYWSGLVSWLEGRALRDKMISRRDLQLFKLTDDLEEVVDITLRYYERRKRSRGPRAGNGRETP